MVSYKFTHLLKCKCYSHFIHHTGYVYVISFPNISFTMYLDTVKELQKWQDEAEHWKSQPTVSHTSHNGMGEVCIELCHAIGKVTPRSKESPIKFPNQPSFHPKNSRYQFDLQKFKGEESKDDLIASLKQSCKGCSMYLHKDISPSTKEFQLRCVHYPLQHKSSLKFSDTQKFSKDDCVTETVKMQKGKNNNAFSRMANPKLRTKKNSKATVDRRQNQKQISSSHKSNNRRVSTVRAASSATRCHMNLRVFLDEKAGSWHLHQSSNLDHKFHVPSVEDSTTLKKKDLTSEQLSTLNVLFDSGVSPTIIAKAMTESVHSSTGKKGAFLAQTIANIGCQERKTMDEISGIKPHWSQAEKVLKILDR